MLNSFGQQAGFGISCDKSRVMYIGNGGSCNSYGAQLGVCGDTICCDGGASSSTRHDQPEAGL